MGADVSEKAPGKPGKVGSMESTQDVAVEEAAEESFSLAPAEHPSDGGSEKKSKRKTPLTLDSWKGIAREIAQSRMDWMILYDQISENCTQQQLTPVQAVIDRMSVAIVKLEATAFAQVGKAAVGIFSVESDPDEV